MADTANVFLTGPQVVARYCITQMTLWRWVRDDKLGFPQPMTVNRRRFFRLTDLVAWEQRQLTRGAA